MSNDTTDHRREELEKLSSEILDTLRREAYDMAARALERLEMNGVETSPLNVRVNIEIAQAHKLAAERFELVIGWYAGSVLSETFGYCKDCAELEPICGETNQCADCGEIQRDDLEMSTREKGEGEA